MKRYYAHYSYIFPDNFLKNTVIELEDNGLINSYFPFEKETSDTVFHSGLQLFIPFGTDESKAKKEFVKNYPSLGYLLEDALIRRFRV